MGVLGPEFLLMLTLGQWTSARASVKELTEMGHRDWTIVHGFYADMGGFVLHGPGIEIPFPIDAQQFLFLVKHGYIEYPRITKEDIMDRNKSDGLARCIAVCQAVWMVIDCFTRVGLGLTLTKLELTTLSFILVFLVTSFCWYYKPQDVTTTVPIHCVVHIDQILAENGIHGINPWHTSPLDFVHDEAFFCERFWRYYMEILSKVHLSIFSRKVDTRPYNRIPSDRFQSLDRLAEVIGAPVIVGFGCIFMFAWNFNFPSPTEQLLWRAASIYTLVYTFFGSACAQYCHKILLPRWSKQRAPLPIAQRDNLPAILRNIHPSKDPRLDIPLRALIPVSVLCALYCVCRGYILVEDFVGLRSLPATAFQTVEWSDYVPHW
ncbi:hypothetical protein P168DRAFT_323107 [Aspergillus campestris IBT 28561]|uniref:Wax synthase domain-containing protein n=1 Tax=Aspergillus campestris (strain IBT 28561) TaxID=1392248 RepID=A0A2I1DDF4_ASPC2|nr:uncharacterized protein P168DRAFT_323107 [Aspergillus campestris IBT 28561]PKY07896.1 hypothetical protein P168DRAFT_323107 [Aspergillus campestris IBT 28561]